MSAMVLSMAWSVDVKGDRQWGPLSLQLSDLFDSGSPALFPLGKPGLGPEQGTPFTTAHRTPGCFIVPRAHQVRADGTRERNGRFCVSRDDDDETLGMVFDQAVAEVRSPGHASLYTTRASFSTLLTSMMWSATSLTPSTWVMTMMVLKYLFNEVSRRLQHSTDAGSIGPNASSMMNMSVFGNDERLIRATRRAMEATVFSMPDPSSIGRRESP